MGNPGTAGDASPVILTTLGLSVPVFHWGLFFFEPGVLVWGTRYEWVIEELRAVPTQIETANQAWVLGLWLAPRLGVKIPLADGLFELGFTGTMAFNIRIPLVSPAANDDVLAAEYRGYMARYFWDKARFLYPETDIFFRWNAFDTLALTAGVRVLWPWFHIWDGEGLPFGDQFVFAATIGFSMVFPLIRDGGE